MMAAALIKTHLSFINLGHQDQLPCTTPQGISSPLHSGHIQVGLSHDSVKHFNLKCVSRTCKRAGIWT